VLFPNIVPGSALGLDEKLAPSNRITLGLIGCGSRMGGIWQEGFAGAAGVEALAVCDVWKPARDNWGNKLKLPAESRYNDFRELIARKDIDAVVIASPDHWHVPMSIAAIKSGKDVYCEKPLSNTIGEGRVLADTVKRYGAVFQHGTQLRSDGGTRRACEMARNKIIGDLKEVLVGVPGGRTCGVCEEQPIPEGLDYDLWLGPAPIQPFTHNRVFINPQTKLQGWYFCKDYSIAGWLAGFMHDIDIAHWGMDTEYTGPVRIEGEGVYPKEGLYDTILTFDIELKYANGAIVKMRDTGKLRQGVTFVGTKGSVWTRAGIEAKPPELLREPVPNDSIHLYRNSNGNHAQNFIDCVRTRRNPIADAEIAHRATSAGQLAELACFLRRPLEWDPQKERFINDAEADTYLRCHQREPWRV
jgi:predicted dehydrogenase